MFTNFVNLNRDIHLYKRTLGNILHHPGRNCSRESTWLAGYDVHGDHCSVTHSSVMVNTILTVSWFVTQVKAEVLRWWWGEADEGWSDSDWQPWMGHFLPGPSLSSLRTASTPCSLSLLSVALVLTFCLVCVLAAQHWHTHARTTHTVQVSRYVSVFARKQYCCGSKYVN